MVVVSGERRISLWRCRALFIVRKHVRGTRAAAAEPAAAELEWSGNYTCKGPTRVRDLLA